MTGPAAPCKGHARAWLLTMCLGAALISTPLATAADTTTKPVTLTAEKTRAAAMQALSQGNAATAYQLARGLLKINPRDPSAYFLIARAMRIMGKPTLGRKAAQYAFRYSENPDHRFLAAQLAARFAFDEGRHLPAQYWLRRSHDHAPNDRAKTQTGRDFRRVAAANPLSFHLSFSIAPSDNVNSGAQTDRLTVEGDPWFNWPISSDGQALPGTVTTAGIDMAYRLRQNRQSQTKLLLKLSARHVHFTSDVRRRLTAGLTASDFSSHGVELGLSHAMRMGEKAMGRVTVSLGKRWYGGRPYLTYGRLGYDHTMAMGDKRFLRLGATVERRDYDDRFPATQLEARADYVITRPRGARLTGGVVLARTWADGANRAHDRATLYGNIQPARRIGPAKASLTLGVGRVDYPSYILLVPLAGGRSENSLFGAATLHFDQLSFAGFSPAVTLHAKRTRSNISRFDVNETTLSIGIRSNF